MLQPSCLHSAIGGLTVYSRHIVKETWDISPYVHSLLLQCDNTDSNMSRWLDDYSYPEQWHYTCCTRVQLTHFLGISCPAAHYTVNLPSFNFIFIMMSQRPSILCHRRPGFTVARPSGMKIMKYHCHVMSLQMYI